jgi:hypothetical protein
MKKTKYLNFIKRKEQGWYKFRNNCTFVINYNKKEMGRAFEFRKGRKMKRWSAMANIYKNGKDIVMAVKEGGPNLMLIRD